MPREKRKVAVLIAGMHRSGTSALARLLGLVGCDLPAHLMRPTDDNPTGHWESQLVMDLNDEILASAGTVWDDWRAFDADWYVSPVAEEYRDRAQTILRKEFGDSRLFVLKDPRICRLLKFWIEAVGNFGAQPCIVSPVRNPIDVAASLEARDGIDPCLGHLIWLRHVLDAEMESRHLRRAYLRYETLLAEVHKIVDALGQVLDVSWPRRLSVDAEMQIENFTSSALHHHRTDSSLLSTNPRLSRWIVSGFEILDRWCRGEVHETDTAKLGQIRSALDAATPAFSRILAVSERKIAQRDRQNDELTNVIAERDSQIEQLNADHDSRIEQLTTERDSRIEQLITERDSQIEQLIADHDSRIEQLDNSISEYEWSISGLSRGIAERDGRLDALNQAVADRDRRIDELNQTVSERDGQIDGLDSTITERGERIEALAQIVADQEERAEALNHAAIRRDEQIEALDLSLSDRDGQIEALNQALSERDGQIEVFNHTVSERDGQIEVLNHAVSERDEQIDVLNRTISERDEQIETLDHVVADRNGRIEDLLETVSERDRRIGESDRTSTEYDYRIAALNRELSEHRSRGEELAQASAKSRNQMEKLDQAVFERDERIGELQQAAAELEGRIEDLNQAVVERDRRLERLDRSIARRDGMSIGFFSICAKNYLPYARTLHRSLMEQYRDVRFYLVLADRADGHLDLDGEEFPVLEARSLGIDDFDGMSFRYDITELNTAIKPSCFTFLFERYGHDAMIYLDPDIYVVNQMEEIRDCFAEGAEMILTPHICSPIEDEYLPNDFTMLQSGIYNLGFLALANTDQVRGLLHWWAARLRHDCRMDPDQGLHVDQKWMDLSPAFVEQTKILHHEGYNVAYWNLMHREVRRASGCWFVNESPLIFFHFSGAELSNPNVLSKHQNRFDSRNIGDLRELLREYRAKVTECGLVDFSDLPYAYDYSIDGNRIHSLVRRMYREEMEPSEQQENPWHTAVEFCNTAALETTDDRQLLITRIMHRIWRERTDLQQAFDLNTSDGRRGFVEWYMHSATREVGLNSVFVDDVAKCYFSEDLPLRKDADFRRRILQWILFTAVPKLAFIHRKFPVETRNRAKAFLLRHSYFVESSDKNRLTSSLGTKAGNDGNPPIPALDRKGNGKTLKRDRDLDPGALLVGYPRAELGMGEHVRLSAKAFATADVGFGIFDFNFNIVSRQEDERLSHYIVDDPKYRTNIFHINADQMDLARKMLGSDFFDSRYNIGYWMWELSEFPDAWLPALDMVDEVWAPSRFTQQAISAKARCPVPWMPLAVDMNVTSHITRDDLALPNDHFLFLFNFDFASWFSRKNPIDIISAFRRSFQEEKVKLVLKTMRLEWHDEEFRELKDVIDDDRRIILIDRTLSFEENFALERCCDAFVSLHRSEGFGRGIAESMALGKPVIATNYSGNTDFTLDGNSCLVDYQLVPVEPGQYPYGDGQVWADPDVEQAGWYMRRLVDDPSYGKRLGAAAKKFILENHSPKVIGARYAQRLDFLGTV